MTTGNIPVARNPSTAHQPTRASIRTSSSTPDTFKGSTGPEDIQDRKIGGCFSNRRTIRGSNFPGFSIKPIPIDPKGWSPPTPAGSSRGCRSSWFSRRDGPAIPARFAKLLQPLIIQMPNELFELTNIGIFRALGVMQAPHHGPQPRGLVSPTSRPPRPETRHTPSSTWETIPFHFWEGSRTPGKFDTAPESWLAIPQCAFRPEKRKLSHSRGLDHPTRAPYDQGEPFIHGPTKGKRIKYHRPNREYYIVPPMIGCCRDY